MRPSKIVQHARRIVPARSNVISVENENELSYNLSVEEPAAEVQLPVHVADVDQFEVFSVEDKSLFDESERLSEYWIESDSCSAEETNLNV